MAPRNEYSEPEVVEDDAPAVEESGVDAQAEDEAVTNEPEAKQVQNELGDLDQGNIIDNSDGPSTRGNKGDPMAADKAIDQDIDNAEQELS
ncbi:hypothetical protein BDZ90DRAFT_234447 [Jaminaea rosea]|uniref:Uncharacterized protein n=1 Tax=Jaminaea rosea TaxID=1569628 RepID=A0A316UJ58_9BASI|nr:hypothetical protein BDZ90DRAFT_234447 [Jaminaea rosea]PWN25249.1 hypothetical protein BDZ90DRAFT_234447 [Jaminaea rosea]